MALTVQQCIDDSAYDSRLNLDGTAGSGSDYSLLIRWCDRIHKDVLHQSVFAHHARKVETKALTSATGSYTLSSTDIRRVEMVYDTVFNYILQPLDNLLLPASDDDPKSLPAMPAAAPPSILTDLTNVLRPRYYRVTTATSGGTNTHKLYIFPAPANSQNTGSVDVHYEKEVSSVANGSDNLEVPADARDVMVAGVNWMMFAYLQRGDDATRWFQVYEALKRGERVLK